jgi:uncharacterized membrane protein
MQDQKNTVTNVIAVIIVVGSSVNSYLESVTGDINWITLGVGVVTAVIAWYTGRDKDGKKK